MVRPVQAATPALEKAVNAAGGKVKLVKMNIDDHPSIAGQLGIQSIPAVIAFKNGQPVDGFMGAIPESQINEFLRRVVGKGAGAEIAEALAAATEARAAGDAADRGRHLLRAAASSPTMSRPRRGLADLLFEAGDHEAARACSAASPDDKEDTPAVAAVRAKIKLAEEAAALGNPAELERGWRATRKIIRHASTSPSSRTRWASGPRQPTICWPSSRPTATGRTTRRAQLLKFFDAWGMTDEATLASRRKLSSILFS